MARLNLIEIPLWVKLFVLYFRQFDAKVFELASERVVV